mgnify:CR=1 FL=1
MKLVIYGNSDFAELMYYYFTNDSKYEVVGFCVDKDFIKSDNFLDKPLVSFEEVEKIFPPNEYKMFVAVGYKNMRLRTKLYKKTVDKRYEHINYISSKSIIDESNIIGKNNAILHGVVLEPFAKIGDKNFILPSKNDVNRLVDFCHPALHNPKPITIDFTKSVVMITGVNAGGKTMMLKSILSAVFLSKYLLPYKAHHDTVVSNFKSINAVLDDPQSVKNDISTFAGRMVEFSKLFASKNAIVGVDEIELGTDSDEAASLFKVIIEDLIQRDIKVIITTHHKRLAALMASNENVELIAALYDEENQKPTYEFLQGTIGRSYAFETASRYGIPYSVVKRAKEVYGDDKDKLNELIERSSSLEREYKQKIAKLDDEIKNMQRITSNLKDQKEKLDEHIYSEKSKLHKEYSDARDEAKKAIKAKLVGESHQHLNIAHKMANEIKTEKVQEVVEFSVGDRIKYRNTKGTIVSIKGAKAFIENDMGMKVQVLLADLSRSGNPPPKIPTKKATVTIEKPETGNIKLDLHGQRADEAIENLDKFLSDALLAGFEEVLVYHGIGTGKLAFAVKEYLKKHPKVRGFEDAHPSSGGFGAKVIKL